MGTGASAVQVLAQTKNITADNPASDSTPLYSPDGRYIAYRAQQRPGYESDRFRLMLYDRKTGEKKNLTENLRSLGGNICVVAGLDYDLFRYQWQDDGLWNLSVDRRSDRQVTVDGDAEETRRIR